MGVSSTASFTARWTYGRQTVVVLAGVARNHADDVTVVFAVWLRTLFFNVAVVIGNRTSAKSGQMFVAQQAVQQCSSSCLIFVY